MDECWYSLNSTTNCKVPCQYKKTTTDSDKSPGPAIGNDRLLALSKVFSNYSTAISFGFDASLTGNLKVRMPASSLAEMRSLSMSTFSDNTSR